MISIAIVDDHAMVRMGLKYVINLHSDEFSFAGEHPCGTGVAVALFGVVELCVSWRRSTFSRSVLPALHLQAENGRKRRKPKNEKGVKCNE